MNPMEMIVNQMFANNPMFQRAKQMADGKSEQELMRVVQNLCEQRGINIQEAYKQFQTQMKQMQRMFGNK